MSKGEIKQTIVILLFGVINTVISFSITSFFGFSNVIIFHSFSVIYGDITWEVIIFLGLSLIETLIYGLFSGELVELLDNDY